MANAATAAEPKARREGAKVDVAPELLSVLGSASAPVSVPKPVPPPESMPGVGSFFGSIGAVLRSLSHGIEYSSELREEYGDIHRFAFPGVPMVVVWDADEIQRILRNEDQAWSTGAGWTMSMMQGLDTRGGNIGTLLSLDFDDHKTARKLVQPAFTTRALEGYIRTADARFAEAIPPWIERGQVGFKAEIRTLLASVAGEIFTGIREPERVAAVDRALSDFWHGMMALSRNPWLSQRFRRSRKGLRTLIETFLALVPERRQSGGEDLFSRLCAVVDTDGLDDEAIVRVFITIMFGAFDTTSAGMTSMAYLLAKHADWQERLRAEARSVRPGEDGQLDLAAMRSLKQLEWAWKETLRLLPVNGYLPRCALRNVEIAGHAIGAGTLVMPMNGGIGRHPKWWREPTKFDPLRFSPERAEDKQHPGLFNPFGAGAHACVGMQLANMEMKAFWHRLLRSCRFHLTRDYEARHTFTPMGIVSGSVALTLEALA